MAIKLDAWRSIAELVAAIAVVLSVIYLAVEIRTATRVISIERSSELYSSFDDLVDLVITDEKLRKTITLAEHDYDSLSDDQRIIHSYYYLRMFNLWERSWGYHASGLMDDEAWSAWEKGWVQIPCDGWIAWAQWEKGMNKGLVERMHTVIFPALSCSTIKNIASSPD